MNIITIKKPSLAAYIEMIGNAEMRLSDLEGHVDLYIEEDIKKDVNYWHNQFVVSPFFVYNNSLIKAQELKRRSFIKR